VLCNIQTPGINATAERWIGGCRRELLDRALIWNQAHLRRVLSQYKAHTDYRTRSTLTTTASESTSPSLALSANIAWSHDADEVFGTPRR
jgi:hypothetical protein